MGFYDRSLIQAVANAPQTYGTLNVVPMGGGASLTNVFGDISLHEVLAAPPAGYVYRLQLFSATGGGIGAILQGVNTGNTYCYLMNPGSFLLAGLLCPEGLYVGNNSATNSRTTLFYDTILTPYVS
jgi:hypothetical protein